MGSPEIVAGKYQILSRLGKGGMGVVYEAVNVLTGRRVALKILDMDASEGAGLFREARAAGQLQSRHVAQVLDAGTDEGKAYIVLELLRGADLGAVLATRACLESDLALRLVGQACSGLVKAHAAGVLHRDIKPANLFVAREDDQLVVKLLDFGLAKAMTPEALGEIGRRSLTSARTLVGTPFYMSPEQARGAKNIDGRSDLWSLGIVLYEALTGRTPHEEDASSLGSIILAICSKQIRIADQAPDVSGDVAALIDKALDLDAAHRFQTAEEMLDAIRSLVGSLTIGSAMLDATLGLASTRTRGRGHRPVYEDETIATDAPADSLRVRTLTLTGSQVIVETSVRDGYVLACVHGRMSNAADAHTSNAFLGEALEAAGLRALLLDARRADGTKQGHDGLWVWIRENRSFDRMALLVESSALKRGFNLQAAEYSVNARAFDDLNEAEAWLRDRAV